MSRVILIVLIISSACAAWAQRFTRVFNTVSEMVAANPNSPHTNAAVLGYYSAWDGGGGPFYYDANSAAATNLGVVFKPGGYGGRWLRWFDGKISAKQFGAKGNGSADDTAALQAALDYAGTRPGLLLTVPQGVYLVTGSLALPGSISIEGYDWKESVLSNTSAASTLVRLSGTAGWASVKNLGFSVSGTNSAQYHCEWLRVTNAVIEHCYFENAAGGAIQFRLSTNCAARSNFIRGNNGYSASNTGQILCWTTDQVLIEGNVIEDGRIPGILHLNDTLHSTIRNNIIRRAGGFGVGYSGTGHVVEGNTAADINIVSDAGEGFNCHPAADIVFRGNTAANCGTWGITANECWNSVFSGNHSISNSSGGIWIAFTGTYQDARRSIISGNYSSHNQREGFYISGYAISVAGNQAYDNGISGVASQNADFNFGACTNLYFAGNMAGNIDTAQTNRWAVEFTGTAYSGVKIGDNDFRRVQHPGGPIEPDSAVFPAAVFGATSAGGAVTAGGLADDLALSGITLDDSVIVTTNLIVNGACYGNGAGLTNVPPSYLGPPQWVFNARKQIGGMPAQLGDWTCNELAHVAAPSGTGTEIAFSASGGGSQSVAAGYNGRHGIQRLSSGTTAGGKAFMQSALSAYEYNDGDKLLVLFCWSIPAGATYTNQLVIGFGDSTATTNSTADGFYAVYDPTFNAGKFIAVSSSNSVRTFNTNVAMNPLAAGAWYVTGALIESASKAVLWHGTLSANIAAASTNASNIPAGDGREFGYLFNVIAGPNSAETQVDLDAVYREYIPAGIK